MICTLYIVYSCIVDMTAYVKYSDYNLQLLRVFNCRSILHSVKKQVQLHFSCTAVSSEDSSADESSDETAVQLHERSHENKKYLAALTSFHKDNPCSTKPIKLI